jgi:hypothetical protein
MEAKGEKVSLRELQSVLEKMNFYKREQGYIAKNLFGKLEFFDAEPSFGGAPVTKADILHYIQEY